MWLSPALHSSGLCLLHALSEFLGWLPSWSQYGCPEPPLVLPSPPSHLGRAGARHFLQRCPVNSEVHLDGTGSVVGGGCDTCSSLCAPCPGSGACSLVGRGGAEGDGATALCSTSAGAREGSAQAGDPAGDEPPARPGHPAPAPPAHPRAGGQVPRPERDAGGLTLACGLLRITGRRGFSPSCQIKPFPPQTCSIVLIPLSSTVDRPLRRISPLPLSPNSRPLVPL